LAETKDHLDWELIGACGEKLLAGKQAKVLKDADEEIEDQEDEHLYHTKGWCRELWIQSLGMKAVLPPPEEKKRRDAMDSIVIATQRHVRRGGRSPRRRCPSARRTWPRKADLAVQSGCPGKLCDRGIVAARLRSQSTRHAATKAR
jgi:hypothetical protein